MLIIISQDDLTIKCILNRENNLNYRIIAFRALNDPKVFQNELRTMLNDEEESSELRILAFQVLSSEFSLTELNNLIKNVKSDQLRFYIKSLFKQSSLWLRNSGSYEFPFGKMNVIYNENSSLFLPYMIQLDLIHDTELDIYFIRKNVSTMVGEFCFNYFCIFSLSFVI